MARPTHGAGFYLAGPTSDERNADAAFIKITLVAAQRAVAVEVAGQVPTLMVRAIVAGEEHERMVGDFQFIEQIEYLANSAVHASHHAGKHRGRVAYLRPAVPANFIFVLRKFFAERGGILLRHMHCGVRDGDGQVGEERSLGIVANKLERLLVNEVV